MRIAVIGGGSAGLVTAHLLDGTHEVTVFEKEPILGGHVRTLNRNVAVSGLEHVLDAGVIEFERNNFPTVMRLFDALGCVRREVPGNTTFWTNDGVHHLSPGSMQRGNLSFAQRVGQLADQLRLRVGLAQFNLRTRISEAELDLHTLGDLLTDRDVDRWLALLTTYAYSIPYERVLDVPAALAVTMLRNFERVEGWVSLQGGSYDYLSRIVERFSGALHTSARVMGVSRHETGVTLRMATGAQLDFDKVVFAVPPDQTLGLLSDPTEAERRRFGSWRGNVVHTLVHHDRSLYTRRNVELMTEFDLIETAPGRGGYNAHLNALCRIPPSDGRAFGLAFGLDDEVDPETIVHRQEHHAPDYTVEAYRWRRAVSETNGENHTLHAGAWLGDGLQEGAVTSAVAVSKRLGGRTI